MRTYCGELNKEHINQTVEIFGWTNRRRDHGGVIFLDIRVYQTYWKPYRTYLTPILTDVTKGMQKEDLVQVTLECPDLDFPIRLPFMQMTPTIILCDCTTRRYLFFVK